MLLIAGFTLTPAAMTYADGDGALSDDDCAILDCSQGNNTDGSGIKYILDIILNVLTFGVGSAAVIGFIISAYQYITARDNSGQVLKAKTRMLQIVIGLAIYALFWVVIKLLLPGGI